MASKKRKPKDQAPGWAWMLFGLSIGLAVALVVYLKSGGPDAPRASAPVAAGSEPITRAVPSPPSAARSVEADQDSANDAAGPDFDFFRRLPQSEVVVPGSSVDARAESLRPQNYVIQAGSFTSYEDADRRRAALVLLGIESEIERAIIRDEVYYRVIVGPLSDRGDVNRVSRRLREERIETMPPRPVSE